MTAKQNCLNTALILKPWNSLSRSLVAVWIDLTGTVNLGYWTGKKPEQSCKLRHLQRSRVERKTLPFVPLYGLIHQRCLCTNCIDLHTWCTLQFTHDSKSPAYCAQFPDTGGYLPTTHIVTGILITLLGTSRGGNGQTLVSNNYHNTVTHRWTKASFTADITAMRKNDEDN